jgi:nucleotide-binding universal stress UspA family protein
MYRTIVVGYDGTDQADDGLALGAQLAKLTGARLVLAFAYAGEAIPVGIGSALIGVSLRQEAESVLARGVGLVPEGVHASSIPLRGSPPARALHELTAREEASLLVLGPAEYGPVARVLVGSVATRLLNGLPCPIAVAPNGYKHAGHSVARIGVCWNDSPEAALALDAAVELARLASADLYLSHVVDPTVYVHTPLPALFMPDRDEITRAAEELLAATVNELPGDVRATSRVLLGSPAAMLAESAERERLDLLVIGSRGYGPMRRVLLGGVSGRVIHTAPCPVLIVPNAATNRPRPGTEQAEVAISAANV